MREPVPPVSSSDGKPSQSSPLRGHVLVVEDEPSIAMLFQIVLVHAGWSCSTTACAVDALAALRERRPDVVLCDVMLPDIDGIRLIRLMKRIEEDLPVIMVSANDDPQCKRAAVEQGASDFLLKPVRLQHLLARITEVARPST